MTFYFLPFGLFFFSFLIFSFFKNCEKLFLRHEIHFFSVESFSILLLFDPSFEFHGTKNESIHDRSNERKDFQITNKTLRPCFGFIFATKSSAFRRNSCSTIFVPRKVNFNGNNFLRCTRWNEVDSDLKYKSNSFL